MMFIMLSTFNIDSYETGTKIKLWTYVSAEYEGHGIKFGVMAWVRILDKEAELLIITPNEMTVCSRWTGNLKFNYHGRVVFSILLDWTELFLCAFEQLAC